MKSVSRLVLPILFLLVIPRLFNLKTARAIGLDIPAVILLQADEVLK